MTACRNTLIYKPSVFIQRLVCLSDCDIVLFICGQITDSIRNYVINLVNLAVRCLDETETVDTSVVRKRTDKTDVRTFRSLNRTHTAVVRVMYVADFKACTLTGETARAKSRKTALMRKLRQRIVLIHELRKL